MGVLVLAVLLLVVMPALLYLIGWSVTRITRKPPRWIGFPAAPLPRGLDAGVKPSEKKAS